MHPTRWHKTQFISLCPGSILPAEGKLKWVYFININHFILFVGSRVHFPCGGTSEKLEWEVVWPCWYELPDWCGCGWILGSIRWTEECWGHQCTTEGEFHTQRAHKERTIHGKHICCAWWARDLCMHCYNYNVGGILLTVTLYPEMCFLSLEFIIIMLICCVSFSTYLQSPGVSHWSLPRHSRLGQFCSCWCHHWSTL